MQDRDSAESWTALHHLLQKRTGSDKLNKKGSRLESVRKYTKLYFRQVIK